MKILHVSTSDVTGGAARAAYRLHGGLIGAKVESQMLVQLKASHDESVLAPSSNFSKARSLLHPLLDHLPLRLYPMRQKITWSTGLLGNNVPRRIKQDSPDIVNLHWICKGFLSTRGFTQIHVPTIWTLHDSWAFTGGCHLPLDCLRYRESCGACPQLKSNNEYDLSRWVWLQKRHCWKGLDLTIVTPSNWLRGCATSSALFKNLHVEVLPNGIDTKIYRPINQTLARQVLGFPLDKKLILAGAMGMTSDPIKGFDYLQQALEIAGSSELAQDAEFVLFGASALPNNLELAFKTHCAGVLHDEVTLAMLYSAVDLFVSPSIQENLPYTVMEAMACGTPCVAFNIGGMPDMIDHHRNGYLAEPFSADDLAKGIVWVLDDESRRQELSARSREKVEDDFAIEKVTRRYITLYEEILERSRARKSERLLT